MVDKVLEDLSERTWLEEAACRSTSQTAGKTADRKLPQHVHPHFRLWITSDCTRELLYLPISYKMPSRYENSYNLKCVKYVCVSISPWLFVNTATCFSHVVCHMTGDMTQLGKPDPAWPSWRHLSNSSLIQPVYINASCNEDLYGHN